MAPSCPDPPHEPVRPDPDEDVSFLAGGDRTVMVQAPTELGPYKLTKLLGRGGMGEVWQAFDTNLERDVAVKLMRKELLANEEAVKRFAREARAVARLNHPNIVQVYTFGDEQGVLYFVMELVEGETITQRMKQCGVVSLQECVFMLLQAIEGLSYANARGIIHRDIKPSNLMLTPDYRIKIADFGLAKMIEHDTQMTAAGTTMGSPNYMSPEQARGEEADHRSDIYALGISFYQMLTGQLPFTAEQPITVLLKQIQEPLPEPVVLQAMSNGRVLDVLKKMTAKAPDERYQTYGGLAAAISSLAPDVRVKGGHVSTTSMPPAEVPSNSPPIAPGTAVFAAGQDGGASASAAQPAQKPPAPATEPMLNRGDAGVPPPPATSPQYGTPATPESIQGALQPTPASTQTALGTAAPAGSPMRTTMFMIAAAAGTAAVVTLAGIWVFHQMQLRRAERGPVVRQRAARIAERQAAEQGPLASTTEKPQATPKATATVAAVPTAAPTPVQTPSAIVTAAPTAQIQPTAAPTAMTQPTAVTAVTPALAPTSAVTFATPAPTPTPATVDTMILGSADTPQGVPVNLLDAQGRTLTSLAAGSRLPFLRMDGAGATARYVVSWSGQTAYVPIGSGHLPTGQADTGNGPAPGTRQVLLGGSRSKEGDKIDLYRDANVTHQLTNLPYGTVLNVIEEPTGPFLRVGMPNGKEAYVLKANTTRK